MRRDFTVPTGSPSSSAAWGAVRSPKYTTRRISWWAGLSWDRAAATKTDSTTAPAWSSADVSSAEGSATSKGRARRARIRSTATLCATRNSQLRTEPRPGVRESALRHARSMASCTTSSAWWWSPSRRVAYACSFGPCSSYSERTSARRSSSDIGRTAWPDSRSTVWEFMSPGRSYPFRFTGSGTLAVIDERPPPCTHNASKRHRSRTRQKRRRNYPAELRPRPAKTVPAKKGRPGRRPGRRGDVSGVEPDAVQQIGGGPVEHCDAGRRRQLSGPGAVDQRSPAPPVPGEGGGGDRPAPSPRTRYNRASRVLLPEPGSPASRTSDPAG